MRHRADDPDGLRRSAEERREAFLRAHVPPGASGQVRSVAKRFALLGAAGELAREYGVLPWPGGDALRAAGACFAAEAERAIAQVRACIEAHGESRFTELRSGGRDGTPPAQGKTVNRLGFRRLVGRGRTPRWQHLFLPEQWRTEVCRGMDPQRVAEALVTRGLLQREDGSHMTVRVMLPGLGRQRVYAVRPGILGADPA